MANMKNRITLIGRLGQNPELKTFDSGSQKCTFSLATHESIKNAQGEKREETRWHQVVVWGMLSELALKYLKKGDLCALEGKVQYRSYQDAQGVTQYRTEIVGKDLQFLSPVSGAEIPNEAK